MVIINKKNVVCKVLIITLLINQSTFTMQNQLVQAIAFSTIYNILIYGFGRGLGLSTIHTYENAPQNIQTWARRILSQKKITNADSVPLKLGNRWAVVNGLFIQINKESAKELEKILSQKQITQDMQEKIIQAERTLLHEAKHYHNNDYGKIFLVSILSFIPFSYIVISFLYDYIGASGRKISYALSMLKFLITGALSVIPRTAYTRYAENEADRFAFMNFSSIKNLEIWKNWYLKQTELSELCLELYPIQQNRSWLGNKTRSALSSKLIKINQELSKNNHEKVDQLIRQKKY